MTSIESRVAARYKSKRKIPDSDTIVYEYSDRQIAKRNNDKAERLEKLRKSVHKLRAQVKKDLKSGNPEKVLTALVVGLMDHTAERVGNEESAEDGHFGVTGWQKSHVSFSKGKATVKYVGKSGVKQKKVVTEKALVSALKDVHEGCKDGGLFCHEDGKITAAKVNAYLKEFGSGLTAKNLRGLHANTHMQESLKAIRGAGGELSTDPKKCKAQLKKEFEKALKETAEAVGHEADTLAGDYLVPGLETAYLKDGTVMSKMVKAVCQRFLCRA